MRSLAPGAAFRVLRRLERLFQPWMDNCAMFAEICLMRVDTGNGPMKGSHLDRADSWLLFAPVTPAAILAKSNRKTRAGADPTLRSDAMRSKMLLKSAEA